MYTDGFRMGGKTGMGFLIQVPGEEDVEVSVPLGETPTVYQAEVGAITYGAVKTTIRGIPWGMSLTIFSDNQAYLKALGLEKTSTKSKMIEGCHLTLNRLPRERMVTLRWIPGHQGVEGNERAEDLARQGAWGKRGEDDPDFPVSLCVCLSSSAYLHPEPRKVLEETIGRAYSDVKVKQDDHGYHYKVVKKIKQDEGNGKEYTQDYQEVEAKIIPKGKVVFIGTCIACRTKDPYCLCHMNLFDPRFKSRFTHGCIKSVSSSTIGRSSSAPKCEGSRPTVREPDDFNPPVMAETAWRLEVECNTANFDHGILPVKTLTVAETRTVTKKPT
ncbi:unnamed protein product [Cyprideis torosa]|uniref:RNase H type-1 domain-containing protein n=1 Tax=Cyprideis torosa TaxID=163714 RepID=A0A7R8ZL88_9CRUS|nr:unnamed protein product [Cyprideis torosa]CAG0892875.1 unnamed protein product [Cyprideis torosa]